MIDFIIVLAFITLTAYIAGYREVEIHIDRGRYTRFVQFDFTAGVYIRFGRRSGPIR